MKILITALLLVLLPMQTMAVEEAKSMLDALPAVSILQEMDMDRQREIYDQTQAAYEAYMALPEEERAEILNAEETFGELFGHFNTLVMPVEEAESSDASNLASTILAALIGLLLARAMITKRKL